MLLALAARNVMHADGVPQRALDKLLEHAKWLRRQRHIYFIFGNDQVTPRMHIDEMIAIFSSISGCHFTFETSELYIDDNLSDVSSLELSESDGGDFNANFEMFLLSNNLEAMIEDGRSLFEQLLPKDQKYYKELAKLFTQWSTAYSQSFEVWRLMKVDKSFNVCILLSLLSYNFALFIYFGLQQFAEEEKLSGNSEIHTYIIN